MRCATRDHRSFPQNENPLSTQRRSRALLRESPSEICSNKGRKNSGLKYPRNLKNAPAHRVRNGTSFQASVSMTARRRLLLGTLRLSNSGIPNTKVPSAMNAMVLIVQAKPRGMSRCWTTRMKLTAPTPISIDFQHL